MAATGSDRIRLAVVVGSTRERRAADGFLPWLVDRARDHGRFDVDVLDLREWRLPMFEEPGPDAAGGAARAGRLAGRVAAADAYLFVTPEYNHSVPGALKNALDHVSGRLRNKPAGFVGYSPGIIGGARAVEHLAAIAVEAEMAPLRNAVLLTRVHRAFDGSGRPVDAATEDALTVLLDDLAWWGDALRRARAAGELPPAGRRRAVPAA